MTRKHSQPGIPEAPEPTPGALAVVIAESADEGSNSVAKTTKSLHQLFPRLTYNQCKFLTTFATTGIVNEACRQSGISRSSHQIWLVDPIYRKAFEFCKEEAYEVVEAEVRRRAVDGWTNPVFYKGEVCGQVRQFSDVLAWNLLKSYNPAKFGDKQTITHNNAGDASGIETMLAEALTPSELEDLRQKLETVQRAKQAKALIDAATPAVIETRPDNDPQPDTTPEGADSAGNGQADA